MPDVREFQSVVEEAEQAALAGDFVLAGRRLRDALGLQETSLGADHPDLASTLNNLAVVCETLGQFDDAERFYRRAYAIASGALPPGDPLVATSRDNLKDFCTARGLPLEDWQGLGQPEAAGPAPLPPPPDDPAPAPRHTPAHAAAPPSRRAPTPAPTVPTASATTQRRAEPPVGPWPTRVIGAVLVLAAIGALVVVTSWRSAGPTTPPPATAPPPAPAPPPPAALDAPAPTAPVVATPAPVPPPEPAPAAPPPAATPAAPPVGVRVVVADVCRALSTSGAWRCEPLGNTAAPGRAAFYTRLASPRPLRVEHRWYLGAALRQRVTLAVGANPQAGYRTFSRQTLTPGAWRVELRAADGALLHEAAFDVR